MSHFAQVSELVYRYLSNDGTSVLIIQLLLAVMVSTTGKQRSRSEAQFLRRGSFWLLLVYKVRQRSAGGAPFGRPPLNAPYTTTTAASTTTPTTITTTTTPPRAAAAATNNE